MLAAACWLACAACARPAHLLPQLGQLLRRLARLLLQLLLPGLLLASLGGGVLSQRRQLAVQVFLLPRQQASLLQGVGGLRIGVGAARRLGQRLGQLPKFLGRLGSGLLGLRQRPGLHLVGRLLGRLSGLLGRLRRPGLLALLLADVAGQFGGLAGDLLLLLDELADGVFLGRDGLGLRLLGRQPLHFALQFALLLSQLTSLLGLLPGRQSLRRRLRSVRVALGGGLGWSLLRQLLGQAAPMHGPPRPGAAGPGGPRSSSTPARPGSSERGPAAGPAGPGRPAACGLPVQLLLLLGQALQGLLQGLLACFARLRGGFLHRLPGGLGQGLLLPGQLQGLLAGRIGGLRGGLLSGRLVAGAAGLRLGQLAVPGPRSPRRPWPAGPSLRLAPWRSPVPSGRRPSAGRPAAGRRQRRIWHRGGPAAGPIRPGDRPPSGPWRLAAPAPWPGLGLGGRGALLTGQLVRPRRCRRLRLFLLQLPGQGWAASAAFASCWRASAVDLAFSRAFWASAACLAASVAPLGSSLASSFATSA